MSRKHNKGQRQSNDLVNPLKHSSVTAEGDLPHFKVRKLQIESIRSANFRQSVKDKLNEALRLGTSRQYEAAIALYRQVIQEEPRAHTAYSNIAALMYELGETEAAIALMEESLHKFPRVVTLRVNMARLCFVLGKSVLKKRWLI
jgi:tetratricopeptide (TPR) repeat protein